jgi:uncharacterized protein (TIGR03435 family)
MNAIRTGLLLVALGAAYGQAPEFDVATVKASPAGDGHGGAHNHHGQVRMTNMPLKSYIEMAYGVKEYQLSGPDWLATERYDVLANASPDTPDEQIQQMMQALLGKWFKLAVHRESKVLPVYTLVVAKGGLKLRQLDQTATQSSRGKTQVSGRITMAQLADFLSAVADYGVVDRTGLQGVFEVDLEWSAENPLEAAVQEQAGLKLEAKKLPVDVLIVDRVSRPVF